MIISCSASVFLCNSMAPTLWNNCTGDISRRIKKVCAHPEGWIQKQKWQEAALVCKKAVDVHFLNFRCWEGLFIFFSNILGKWIQQFKICQGSDKLIKLSVLSIICIAKKKNLNFLGTVWQKGNTDKCRKGFFFFSKLSLLLIGNLQE